MGARSSYYHHVFKDLHLIHNGNKSATLISPNNIGGGVGSGGGLVEIDNCIFEQNGANQITNIDYHSQFDGNQTKNVIVKCKDSVFNKKFTVTSIGESTSFKNKLYISNCKMGTPSQSQTGTNFDVIAWNNV